MNVELVETRVVAIVGELNLKLKLVLLHGPFTYRAWGSDTRTAPGPIGCLTR